MSFSVMTWGVFCFLRVLFVFSQCFKFLSYYSWMFKSRILSFWFVLLARNQVTLEVDSQPSKFRKNCKITLAHLHLCGFSRSWLQKNMRWRDRSRRRPSFWRPAPSQRCKWQSHWLHPSSERKMAGTEVGTPITAFPIAPLLLSFCSLSMKSVSVWWLTPWRALTCWHSTSIVLCGLKFSHCGNFLFYVIHLYFWNKK